MKTLILTLMLSSVSMASVPNTCTLSAVEELETMLANKSQRGLDMLLDQAQQRDGKKLNRLYKRFSKRTGFDYTKDEFSQLLIMAELANCFKPRVRPQFEYLDTEAPM